MKNLPTLREDRGGKPRSYRALNTLQKEETRGSRGSGLLVEAVESWIGNHCMEVEVAIT